ncbi:MAG: hypothetical protein HY914_02780 [Desulfomonile tiedjei]|nr:hypothetical protein [Desulfomonile tiedjei]
MTKFALSLALLVLCLGGCASTLTGIAENITERIDCHLKCPGGSPEAERKCYDECRAEQTAEKEERKASEDREKVSDHVKSIVGYPFPPNDLQIDRQAERHGRQ